MKKAIIALAVAAFASTASAAVGGTAHDLSTGYAAKTGTLSSCNYCHAPHHANTEAVVGYGSIPLWNRVDPTVKAAYQLRVPSSAAVPALNVHSLTCLSCHDGAADVGQTFGGSNGFNTSPTTMLVNAANLGATTADGTTYVSGGATPDLRDDHPIGIPMVVATDYALAADVIAVAPTGGLRLYGATNTVECSSCHDPHDTAHGTKFLRKDSTGMCSTCHLK